TASIHRMVIGSPPCRWRVAEGGQLVAECSPSAGLRQRSAVIDHLGGGGAGPTLGADRKAALVGNHRQGPAPGIPAKARDGRKQYPLIIILEASRDLAFEFGRRRATLQEVEEFTIVSFFVTARFANDASHFVLAVTLLEPCREKLDQGP